MEVVTTADRPDLADKAGKAFATRWPEFIFHDATAAKYRPRVLEYFGHYDILLLDDGEVAAGGWAVPFAWDGGTADLPDGYDSALARSVDDHEAGRTPTALSVMAAAVNPDFDKQGLATRVLESLVERAIERGITRVMAPVRPTEKYRYPLHTMAEYATWVRSDGLSVDPWIRTHQRMGATILGPASRSMVISGTVTEWESWTGMRLPGDGEFVIPDGLTTLTVDHRANRATYVEENLWMRHR
ncbi:acetyltransferase (GNAT) family protein [Stackebrandtia endophytica]|uniref:Acetyltransferase (GNAT) family protein n=1 Tax=Stackebrandtia endophytica TaxID=1496996 RepID=A0A543AQ45_9ACTN|nr:GNAT family N-acetyltransferase [Stackebrandtia endophytica]TQL74712.1 acetyltransferase (GNAT) family protein [Stackebrandtia endophytica]